jgi:hypothetical protein
MQAAPPYVAVPVSASTAFGPVPMHQVATCTVRVYGGGESLKKEVKDLCVCVCV